MAESKTIEDIGVDEADVPPLEDLSDLLTTQLGIQLKENSETVKIAADRKFLEPTKTEEQKKAQSIHKLLFPANKSTGTKSENQSKETKGLKSNFGGFQKGFLDRPSKASTKEQKKHIEVLKPRQNKEDTRVLPEVQSSLKELAPILDSKDWITSDLLTKIEKNARLKKYLSNPEFTKALSYMEKEPQRSFEALQSYPEMREALIEFCALMGQHFTHLGSQREVLKPTPSSTPSETKMISQENNEDTVKMQTILNDPEVQLILGDPQIQKLFALLKEGSPSGQRMLQSKDPDFHLKIKKLIDVGLLGVSSG